MSLLLAEQLVQNQPLVTVVTVTYNSSVYVRDAIESVLAQTYKNIEYIIGDDCSTDNTWDIIQSYSDDRILAYRNPQNLREYPNRNKAIQMAKGKYLIFIDGDDIIFPHGIDFFVYMMEKFPEAGLAIQKGYFNNILFPALLSPFETVSNNYFGKKSLLNSSFTSNFFKTDVLKGIGGLRNDLISGDDEVRVRLACNYAVLFVAGWVSWPRETPGQASGKITHEIGLRERIKYTNQIFESKIDIPVLLKTDIQSILKKEAIRFCLKAICKLQLKSAKLIFQNSGMNLTDVLRYLNFQPTSTDLLKEYSSSKPLKKGFLEA